jgi:uncharacterized protein (TIGR03067 family)
MDIQSDLPQGDATDQDLRLFDGTWQLSIWLAEGVETALPGGEKVVSVIQSGKVTERAGTQTQESFIRVDPSRQPKAIDCFMLSGPNRGTTYLGIYEFVGDQLRLCYALAGRPRPTEFSSQPGSGHYLAAFQRVTA